MGFSVVFGLPRVYEPFCWMVVIYISAGFIVKNTKKYRFLHGFLVNRFTLYLEIINL